MDWVRTGKNLIFLVFLICIPVGISLIGPNLALGAGILAAGLIGAVVMFVEAQRYPKQFTECLDCNGTGVKETCPTCRGRGSIKKGK